MTNSDDTQHLVYGAAVTNYLSAGWRGVIPVGRAPGEKSPPPHGFTGWAGVDPSGADIHAWCETAARTFNIALHLQPGVLGIDVDGYDGKQGPAALDALAARAGRSLPATWSSTARGPGQPSRIHFFRAVCPPGRVWIDQPGGNGAGIELVHTGHRYAVVAPSVHPEGGQYGWYAPHDYAAAVLPPAPAELAELPAEWIEVLTKPGEVIGGSAADHESTLRMVHAFRERGDAQPCDRVKYAVTDFRAVLQRTDSGEALHPTANGQLWSLVCLGFEGHRGARNAIAEHYSAFLAARERTGRSKGERDAEAEWWRMVRGAVGKAALRGPIRPLCGCEPEAFAIGIPPDFPTEAPGQAATDPGPAPTVPSPIGLTLPPEFWQARPRLQLIRRAAHSRRLSADAVLYGVLARIAAMVPHDTSVRTFKGRASLNLFAAVVGDSGDGKSSAVSLAGELLPDDPAVALERFPLGSGEGIAEAFMGERTVQDPETGKAKKTRVQVRHNVLLFKDEGAEINKMLERAGATVGEAIRSAWVGAMIGQKNGRAETTRIVHDGTYSLGMVIGYQVETAQPLMADVAAGTPQRFTWVWTSDPHKPRSRADMPRWEPDETLPNPFVRAAEQEHVIAAGIIGTIAPSGINREPVTFAPEIEDALFAEDVRRDEVRAAGGTLDAYLSHAPLMAVKLAALLALLDGRRHVEPDDWALAGVLWQTSDAVRRHILESGKAEAQRVAERRRADHAALETAAAHARHTVQDAREAAAVERVARRIVARIERDGQMPRSSISRAIAARDRIYRDDALEYALAMTWLHEDHGCLQIGTSRPI